MTAFQLSAQGAALVKCNDTGNLDELRPPSPEEKKEAGMDENEIELETVDSLGAGAVSVSEARVLPRALLESAQLTVLVEEQVALLATEAVAFLDRIAEDYPEGPSDVPAPVVPQADLGAHGAALPKLA